LKLLFLKSNLTAIKCNKKEAVL